MAKLKAKEGKTEFSHIPDWYEWQRENVRKEVKEGRYNLDARVKVHAFPNSKGVIPLGEGRLTQTPEGIKLTGEYEGEEYEVFRATQTLYSIHIEFNFLEQFGEAIDISTLDDSYYVYPIDENVSITKVAFATEELYLNKMGKF